MKLKTVLAVVGAAILYATPALCADGAEATGSWRLLGYYAFNFSLFVVIVYIYLAPMVRKFFADRSGSIRSTLGHADRTFKDAQDLANKAAARSAQLENEVKRLAAEWDEETRF